MKILLPALLLILSTVLAHARIGETPAQCVQRYGQPVGKTETGRAIFQKSGLGIIIGFFEGKVDFIAYSKVKQDALGIPEELSENEIEILMKSNGGADKWVPTNAISMDKSWQTETGSLIANYATMQHVLVVATKEWVARSEAAKKAGESKALQGF